MAISKNKGKKKRYKVNKFRLITVLFILILLIVSFNFIMNQRPLSSGGEINLNTSNVNRDKSVNILITGIDSAEERGDQMLTDVIILVSVDIINKKISLLQVPRDSYVGQKYNSSKINAIYSYGSDQKDKINNLLDYFNESFKIKIDHYISIDMDSFIEVVDSLGGVEIDVPYNIPLLNNVDNTISISEGKQVLNGKEAEVFVRYRKGYVEGDIGRVKAQRIFISAVVEQIKKGGLSAIPKVINAMKDNVESDMSIKEMTNYARVAIGVNTNEIEMYTVPGEFANKDGYSYWSMHKKELGELLNSKFRLYSEHVPYKDLEIVQLSKTITDYHENGNTVQDILDGATPGENTIVDESKDDNENSNETYDSKNNSNKNKK